MKEIRNAKNLSAGARGKIPVRRSKYRWEHNVVIHVQDRELWYV
jgi:hypothetical protein